MLILIRIIYLIWAIQSYRDNKSLGGIPISHSYSPVRVRSGKSVIVSVSIVPRVLQIYLRVGQNTKGLTEGHDHSIILTDVRYRVQ